MKLAKLRKQLGLCIYHAVPQSPESTTLCQECLDKRRVVREVWQRRPGRKMWAKTDLMRPVNEIAKELKVNPRAVRYQKKKLFTQTK